MNFNEKVKEINKIMFNIISTKDITYLKDLDKRIKLNKYGKFNYWKIYELNNSKIWQFLYELEDNKVYTLIPFISRNNRPDEPYIILSQQILITSNSSSLLLTNYIDDKIKDVINLYNIKDLEGVLIFKYKKVEIKIEEHNSF